MSHSYRNSHASEGYGVIYSRTYREGYFHYQWKYIEQPLLRKIFRVINGECSGKYLDFACGTGRILKVAEDYFDKTMGVDVSESMLNIARDNCTKSEILQIDITQERLPYSFDVITSFRFFLNAELSLKVAALSAIKGMLTPKGIFIANIHVNGDSPLGLIYRFRNMILRKKIANTMSYGEFKMLLEAQGFSVEKVLWYSYLPRTGWYFDWLPRYFMNFFDFIGNRLSLLPHKMAQSFIVIARPR